MRVKGQPAKNNPKSDSLIPNDIRLWRKHAGMKQAEFAAALGIRRYNVSYWEQGRTLPSWENLNKMIELLGCHGSQLYRNPAILDVIAAGEGR